MQCLLLSLTIAQRRGWMEQRLEFWLSFIQMQCGRFFTREVIYNQADPHSAPNDPNIVRPNVLVVASFGELHQKPFRNSPAVSPKPRRQVCLPSQP